MSRSDLPEPPVRAPPVEPPRRGLVPPPRQQSENDARAGVEGKRCSGGADRREAERLGVLEADRDSGSVVELRVRVRCFVGVSGESEGVSDEAFEALDCWICVAVCASHGVCFGGV
ncbi:hypothetical protein LOK49_LG05G02710 [Camellia lanceoleosa]|uniref:Uncharacterized protein n=1 Tax=Camellia lanceoleosa TaxID=1840588 RepID=A0ACC0HP57_9ERIC|nr:hypothetical protein LOK49_LG05G02710 [Camellia lanceoleosa]